VEEGESGEDLDGGGRGHGEGAEARHGPGGSQGSDWRGVEADVEEEWVRDVEQAVVGEAVDEAPVWTQRRSMRHWRGLDDGGGASTWVAGELIVARVRV
jgi:hypothetical protein